MTRVQTTAEAMRQTGLKPQLHGKYNEQVNLPPAIRQQSELQRTRSAFDRLQEITYADEIEPLLTLEQRAIYSIIIDAVATGEGGTFMADSAAGTGKKFTEKVIAARLRGNGRVVLTVASTAIAAPRSPGGWTAHPMLKLQLL